MSKAKQFTQSIENYEDHQLSDSLNGYTKKKAQSKVNRILADLSKGFFTDSGWVPVHAIWKNLDSAGINPIITGSAYDNAYPAKYKRWKFEIFFKNDKGRDSILYGVITAHGAGSNIDPLSRYDLTAYVS